MTLTLRYESATITTTLNSLFDRIAPASPFSASSVKLPSSLNERCPSSVSSLEGATVVVEVELDVASAFGLDDLLGAFLHDLSTIVEQR
ncbi:MAG: hypothetical protein ACJAR2_000394 [Ilumatobacter sp.]|jgi:hypothetical protein